MIAAKFVEFLQGPVASFIGTRDAMLRPTLTWVIGTRTSAATDEITAFVPDVEIDRTRRNLEHNGLVALVAANAVTHEAYQFKGLMVGMRPTNDEERGIQDIHRAKLASLTRYPRELFAGYTPYPSTAVTFRVEQVFLQTPGPEAGRVLDFSAEAGA
jgi:hypothetical protein